MAYQLISKYKLLRQTSLKQVLEYYGAKFTTNNKAHCFCHEDKNPSLSIYTNESGIEHFKCFSSNISGTVIDLVIRQEGMTFKEAINFIIEEFYNE